MQGFVNYSYAPKNGRANSYVGVKVISDAGKKMRLGNFAFDALKIVVLFVVLVCGLFVAREGYLSTLKEPKPEALISFQATMHPKVGPDVGAVKINLTPTQAFVVGDHIFADIEIQVLGVNWTRNETSMIILVFPESICYVDSWSNTTKQDWSFIWWDYELSGFVYSTPYVVYHKNMTLWYTHEGIFGLNMTVYRPNVRVEWQLNEFYYYDLAHIKSYSYLEEKKSASLASALNMEILGLAIIATSPIWVQFVDLIEKLLKNIKKERNKKQEVNTKIITPFMNREAECIMF